MIGIVLVSHSATLAAGVRELVDQMTQGEVPLALAGGIDDAENPIGTDAFRVQEAIEAVYSEDGVLILMDLGSALLSAEMALEFLSEDQQANIYLCEAPLVEGAIAAAVQAKAGSGIEQVVAEARAALQAKTDQLADIIPALATETTTDAATGPTEEIQLTVENRLGLHARPAARFVNTANQFEANITIRNIDRDRGPVNAKSINKVITLAVRQDHQVAIAAEGPDATEALSALKGLIETKFGEEDEPEESEESQPQRGVSRPPPGQLSGLPASPGIAIGPLSHYRQTTIEITERRIDQPEAEWQRLQQAIDDTHRQIEKMEQETANRVGDDEAAIFQAHTLFLEDPTLTEASRDRIFNAKINAEAAWQQTVEEMVEQYRNLEDDYLVARADDVADVGRQVLITLLGEQAVAFDPTEPVILTAADLSPSQTAQLDPDQILGICTETGNTTAHSAILARSIGIPAVVGVGTELADLKEGTRLALDGETGRIWIDPDEEQLAELKQQQADWLAEQEAALKAGQQPAITPDGHQVEVVANIRGAVDTAAALDYGAEGVGILRTEFLYLDRTTAPDEAEQLEAYQEIAEILGERPLIIRTLDIGGDKPLPYLDMPQEENPFLGWRGIRFCLAQPDLFKSQLRAILRASPGHQIKIMFPMVAAVSEVLAARRLFNEAQEELRQADIPFDETIEVGIMIEVPAAVTLAHQLAAEVDFFSIGTNDLTQYTMAADRTNARVAELADAFQPAVLHMIRQTIQAGHEAGIWVGVCGELAGEPLAAPILLGLELDEFSMNGPAIPRIKQIITSLPLSEAKSIAQKALSLSSADAIRDYIREQLTYYKG